MAQRVHTASTKTIAFLVDWLDSAYQCEILEGAAEAARSSGVNLVCFAGGILASELRGGERRNATYDLVTPENVDGVILMAGSVGNQLTDEELVAYCERFKGLPCVSVSRELPGMSSVAVNNRPGLESAITHLVRNHGLTSIAFVRGTEQNPEAELRFQVYKDVLAANQLPLDEQLVCPGNFLFAGGVAAVATLYDERSVRPQAIVAANDETALGVLEELSRRGIHVPDQVAVVGFDDIENARYASPPLTTVRQPLRQLGREAVRLVMAEGYGAAPGARVGLQTEFVKRRSCHCFSQEGRGDRGAVPSRSSFEAALVERRQILLAELSRAARGSFGLLGSGWEQRLLNGFAEEIRGHEIAFRSLFEDFLDKLLEHQADFNLCHDVLSALRRQMLACLASDADRQKRAEELFQEARTSIGQVSERAQARQRLHVTQWASALAETAAALSASSSASELDAAVARNLPALRLASCFVAAYREGGRQVDFVVRYAADGKLPRLDNVQTLNRGLTRQIANARLQEPLYVSTVFSEKRVIGCVLFELDAKRGIVCEALRGFLGAALRSTEGA